jgi:uncharacterized phiE125 gp8 family phage protein
VALNANALTTLAMAKSFLKVPAGDATQDSIIELCINSASAYLQGATDRKLKSQAYTELRHGSNNNIILLRNYPVTLISEIAIDCESQFTDPNTIISTDRYIICDDSNSVLYINSLFPSGYNNIRIKYTAGYIDVPTDLEMACLWLVHFYYRIRENQDIGRTSKSKMDESISILQDAPQDVKDTIARYRRFEMPLIDSPIMNG